ncbi:MAG TPA: HAMP domain-containing sensor histidine kinase [Candidatus Tectomicrobia bacterium]
MLTLFSLSGNTQILPREGVVKDAEDTRGLRVPLPLLFMFLMLLVIITVYDVLKKSQDVHNEANRRVARAVLESTLTRANSGLNDIASRIASQDRLFDKGPPEVVFRDDITDVEDLANRTLFLGFDTQYQVIEGRIGLNNLAISVLTDLATQPAFSRLFTRQTNVSRPSDTLLIGVNGVPFILSDPQPLAASGRNQRSVFLVVGLPARDVVYNELQKYEIFGSESLKSLLEKQNDISGLAELIMSLQETEYAQFHFSAVAQIVILLVAFVLAVMIGRHIDAKNDDLRQSRDMIVEREREAHHLRQLAEQASEAKSQLIYNMSHELRTPLNAVIGFSEILLKQMFGPLGSQRYLAYVEDIHDSSSHLLGILNSILDLSKAEAGKLTLNEEQVELPRVLDQCLRMFRHRAVEQDIGLTVDLPAQAILLQADPQMLSQVIINLLSNAFKFTPSGGEISVNVTNMEDGRCRICINDTGIGISEEDLPRVIEPFVQVESAFNRRYEGTGLGLPLSKKMVELHGGELEIASKLGEGTSVTIWFPADRAIAASAPATPSATQAIVAA